MAVACAVSIAATIGQASAHTRAQLIGCRVLVGITLAAKASAAPLLTAEVAPNDLRGTYEAGELGMSSRYTKLVLKSWRGE